MMRIVRRLFRLPFQLILIGVAMGLIARTVFPPEKKEVAPRQFKTHAIDIEDELSDIPLQ
jgi:hypothetical protein